MSSSKLCEAGPLKWHRAFQISGPLNWPRLVSVLILFVTGCKPPPPPPGYYGKIESFSQISEKINANDSLIPTLRGAGNFEAWINDNGKTTYVSGGLTLLFQQPHSIRLIGKKDILGMIFEVAANDDRYWLISHPPQESQRTMWWGSFAKLDRERPTQIPIRPELLLDVLGITPIDPEWLKSPSPVMRFNNEADAYVILWNELGRDRWDAQKEIWYDRATLLPRLVLLYDANGRAVLRATLSEHRPVPGSTSGGKIATRYDLLFPDTASRLKFDLTEDLQLKRNGAPNVRSFAFPAQPDVARVISLDGQR